MASISKPLPATGFIRLPVILDHFPVSKSTWWAGCREGRFPPPVKIAPGVTAWKVEDIRALIANPGVPWTVISALTEKGA